MKIAFFGHANYLSKEEDGKTVILLIEQKAKGERVDFYLGGYGSFSSFGYSCAINYRKKYAETRIFFVTPYLGRWLDESRAYLTAKYDDILFPPIENVPPRFAILRRNEWIIDQVDFVVFYVNRNYGGAYRAMRYCMRKQREYKNIGLLTSM